MTMYWLIVLTTMAPLGVHANGLDDFSNNLATDLGPLIVLFGEAMTRQYLSECTSFLDYFIFAMAPIGVLTAMSSAIRVCGHSALRAFIGRSQEGQGAVEAELCTSTSRDVCELFNRGGITRVLGRPSILELVYIPSGKGPGKTAGLYSFKEWVEGSGEDWWKKIEKQKTKYDNKLDSKANSDVGTEPSSHPPNISLNVGIIKRPKWLFRAVAVVGFILQAGLIVLAGVGAWRLGWTKIQAGSPSSKNYAPIMYIIGTFLMSIGMWGCATVIGQTTDEVQYRRLPTEPKTRGTRLFWLQPGPQFIGDQCFDPFAYTDKEKTPLMVWTSSTKNYNAGFGFLSTLAVAATLIGYIMQFIGLRGMKAWLSLAQLAATILMSMLRGGLRAQRLGHDANRLTENPRAPDAVAGHELDWMAFEILKLAPEEQKVSAVKEALWYITGQYEQAKKAAAGTKLRWHITGQYEQALEVDRPQVKSSLSSKQSSTQTGVIEDSSSYILVEVNSSTQPPEISDGGSKISSASDKPGAVITPPSMDGNHGSKTSTNRKEGLIESIAEIHSISPNASLGGSAKGPETPSPLDLKTDLQHSALPDQAENTANRKLSSSMDSKDRALHNKARLPSPHVDAYQITCEDLLCLRSRLANLTGHSSFGETTDGERQWKNDFVKVRSKAKQISSAICQAAAELRPKPDAKQDILLRVIATMSVHDEKQAADSNHCNQTIGITLKPPPEETRVGWQVDSARVEAILGLWMWSMISDGREVKDVPVGNLKIPIEGIVSAGTDRQTDRQQEMDFWLGPQSVMFKETACEIRRRSYGLMSLWEDKKLEKEYKDAQQVQGRDDPKDGTSDLKVRLCGWNPVYEAQADRAEAVEATTPETQKKKSNDAEDGSSFNCRIQTFPASGSLLESCARELFVALAASLTKIVEIAAPSFDATEGGGEVLLRSETVTTLTRAFTENGLGTRADALLSIIPTLRVHLGFPAEDILLSACITKAEAYRRQKEWTRAERLLKWICTRHSSPDNTRSTGSTASGGLLLEKAMGAIGELYRWSFKEKRSAANMKKNTFGMDGIAWMAKSIESSDPTIARIVRSYEYVKTMMKNGSTLGDKDIASKLINALEEGKDRDGTDSDTRCKTLYYLCVIKDCRARAMQPALRLATRNGWTEVALSVMEMGGNVHDTDMDGLTPLHWAAVNGDEAVARELLNNGALYDKESNRHHEEGRVPLHYAAMNGHKAVLGLLLKNGADVEAKDGNGRTPLHLAAENGQEAVVSMLLTNGTNIESLASYWQTPLLLAAPKGHTAVVRLLIENGAEVEAKDFGIETSLHWAARNGHLATVRLLLENGADVDTKNMSSQTPLQVAEMQGVRESAKKETYKEIIGLLRKVES